MPLEPYPSRTQKLWIGGILLLALLVGALAIGPRLRSPTAPGVLEVNNRGIGYMEQFNYARAIEAFEEVTRLAPDWAPGRINLGIALLNEAGRINPSTDELT